MNDKRKSRPVAGTTERAETETAAFGEAANFSDSHFTTPPARRQVVAEWLGTGEGNGRTLKELREFLNGDPRAIRQQIERERRHVPILSGQSGYWLAGSVDEVNAFCRSMRHRARQIWQTASNVEKAAGLSKYNPQLDGQMEIQIGGDSGG